MALSYGEQDEYCTCTVLGTHDECQKVQSLYLEHLVRLWEELSGPYRCYKEDDPGCCDYWANLCNTIRLAANPFGYHQPRNTRTIEKAKPWQGQSILQLTKYLSTLAYFFIPQTMNHAKKLKKVTEKNKRIILTLLVLLWNFPTIFSWFSTDSWYKKPLWTYLLHSRE